MQISRQKRACAGVAQGPAVRSVIPWMAANQPYGHGLGTKRGEHAQMSDMRRREFITLFGGAVAWPLAARAQRAKVVRLGYLEPSRPTDTIAVNLRRQFLLGMRDLGYIEERHFKMEDRNAEGRMDRLPALASELALLPVDIFVVFGDAPIRAAMQVSDRIPIVMTLAADPVGSGFINSLARPGGNVTGLSNQAPDLAGKRLELLKEIIPRSRGWRCCAIRATKQRLPNGTIARSRRVLSD